MKYLVSDSLAAINNAICHREIGDRIYEGRIEAYSCKSNSSEREIHAKLLETLENEYGATNNPSSHNNNNNATTTTNSTTKIEKEKEKKGSTTLEKVEKLNSESTYSSFVFHQQSRRNRSRSNSLDVVNRTNRNTPLGDLNERSTRKLLVDLISTLNAIYPDYDFTSIRPLQFKRHTLEDVRKDIASHLLSSSYIIDDPTNNPNIGALNLPRETSSPYRSSSSHHQHYDDINYRERKTGTSPSSNDENYNICQNKDKDSKLKISIPDPANNSSSPFHDHFRIQPPTAKQETNTNDKNGTGIKQSPYSLSSDSTSNFSSDAISNSPYSMDKNRTTKTGKMEHNQNEGKESPKANQLPFSSPSDLRRNSSEISNDSWISHTSHSSDGVLQRSSSSNSTTINVSDIDIIWNAISDNIDLKSSLIFSYVPDLEGDPFSVGCLWSFNYFFVSKEQKRILYFSVMARDKLQYTPRMQVGLDELGESEGISSEIYDTYHVYDDSNVIVYNNEYAEDEYETDVNEALIESNFSLSRLTEPVSDSLEASLSNPISNSRRSSLSQMDDELYLAAHSSYSENGNRKRKRKKSKDFDGYDEQGETDDDTDNKYQRRQRSLSNASTSTSVSSKVAPESKRPSGHQEQEKVSSYPYAATVIYD